MSWCAKCFTVQTTSDFESEDDGEYEYFANSRYICKRKKSDSSSQPPTLVVAGSPMSCKGASETCSKDAVTRREEDPSIGTQNTNSSSVSSQIEDARVWRVGHASVQHNNEQRIQPFFDNSTSDSNRTLEIIFNTPRREARRPTPTSSSPDYPLQKDSSRTTSSRSASTIGHSPATTPHKRPGLIQRLFGRSGKPDPLPEYELNGLQSSVFKETMELSTPAETTKTLYWTVRVKLKQ